MEHEACAPHSRRRIAYVMRVSHTIQRVDSPILGLSNMKWETPVAIELRLGMEINSYVSVR